MTFPLNAIYHWYLKALFWLALLLLPQLFALLVPPDTGTPLSTLYGLYFWMAGVWLLYFGPVLVIPFLYFSFAIKQMVISFYDKSEHHKRIYLSILLLVLTTLVTISLTLGDFSILNKFRLALLGFSDLVQIGVNLFVLPLLLIPVGVIFMLCFYFIQKTFIEKSLSRMYQPLLTYLIIAGIYSYGYGFFSTLLSFLDTINTGVKLETPFPYANPIVPLLLDVLLPLPALYLIRRSFILGQSRRKKP